MTVDDIKKSKGAEKLREAIVHGMLDALREVIFEELVGIEVCFWLRSIEVYLHGELLTAEWFDDLFNEGIKRADFSDPEERKLWLETAKVFEEAADTIRKKARP
jgi:hypothetical protein